MMSRAATLLGNGVPEYRRTLQYHETLNPLIWDVNDRLKPPVRKHLLNIATEWRDFAKITPSAVTDIALVGGNANFNYTPYSDLDVHLLIHSRVLGNHPDIVFEYLMAKKNLWTQTHHITVYGVGVEPFAEDASKHFPAGQGAYSLLKDAWISKPVKQVVNLNDPHVQLKVQQFMHRIDHLMSGHGNMAEVRSLKLALRTMRSAALQHGGEFAIENLVYKELRNRGYLKKLSDFATQVADKRLSLRREIR